MSLNDNVQFLKGIGPKRAKALARLGVESVMDLFWLVPARYEDRTAFASISDLVANEFRSIKVRVASKNLRRAGRRGMSVFEMLLEDDTGAIKAIFFNQAYLDKAVDIHDELIVYGKPEIYRHQLQLANPEYEPFSTDEVIHTGRVVPVYPLTAGLRQKSLRKAIHLMVEANASLIEETLSDDVINENMLIAREDAFKLIHFPSNIDDIKVARKRLVFEEFYFFEKSVAEKIISRKKLKNAFKFDDSKELLNEFFDVLPFSPTGSQINALNDILRDSRGNSPMSRMLQGDVGSGKTVVAAGALFCCARCGYQSAFLVPTEIVANQHYNSILEWFNKLKIPCALLTGSTKKPERKNILEALKKGDISVLIGTHAVIQKDVSFNNLGLVIIDEQHKFGVRQRDYLFKGKSKPHRLAMSATPIPRSLGLTMYGDMETSILKDFPFGKRDVKTYWVSRKKEMDCYSFVKKQIDAGDQVYIVFPLVEETEKSDLKAAKEEAERLRMSIFRDYTVGLVHGKMKPDDKQKVMAGFKDGSIDILVSTTVIEVGVDNPNASIIIIEHAERFGLSQLHQMRGRVGRGQKESYCFLFGEPGTDIGKKRLKLMTRSNDGFEIAEKDLYLRGPGDFLGTRQSGLPSFKVADIVRDVEILKAAKKAAFMYGMPE